MIVATRHVGIVVRDIEKSLHFWRDVIKLTAPDGSMVELLKDDAAARAEHFAGQDTRGALRELLPRSDDGVAIDGRGLVGSIWNSAHNKCTNGCERLKGDAKVRC